MYIRKFAIKVDNLNLFWGPGGFRSTPDDAKKFDTLEQAKSVAQSLKKPGLVIVEVRVSPQVDDNS